MQSKVDAGHSGEGDCHGRKGKEKSENAKVGERDGWSLRSWQERNVSGERTDLVS